MSRPLSLQIGHRLRQNVLKKQAVTLSLQGINVTLSGNSFMKATTNAWDNRVYSTETINAAGTEWFFEVNTDNFTKYMFFGITNVPTYSPLSDAITGVYTHDGSSFPYGLSSPAASSTATATDGFRMVSDGTNVRFYKNGVFFGIKTIGATPYYFAASCFNAGIGGTIYKHVPTLV